MPFVPCSRYSSVEDRVRAVPEFFVATAFRGSHRFDSRREFRIPDRVKARRSWKAFCRRLKPAQPVGRDERGGRP